MTCVTVLLVLFTALAGATEPKKITPPSAQFDRLSKQATTAREQNNLEDAVKLYRQALKLKPEWKEGWWYLSTLLYDKDQYPEARDGFRKFTALDPKVGPGFALLGLCEFQTKEFPQALADSVPREAECSLPLWIVPFAKRSGNCGERIREGTGAGPEACSRAGNDRDGVRQAGRPGEGSALRRTSGKR
jgi:hypothetical protein